MSSAGGTTTKGPPFTPILRLPPSKPGSDANQCSKVARANAVTAGSSISGLVRCRTPDWSSAGVHVPVLGSGAKKALPVFGAGSVATHDQSRAVNVADGESCAVAKPFAPDSKS